MKIIFLDIDGVMNSHVFYHERAKTFKWKLRCRINVIKSKVKYMLNGFKHKTLAEWKTPNSFYTYAHQIKRLKNETCSEKWEWLSEWCNKNDIKICISSVWRNHFGDEEGRISEWWDKALTDLGFKVGTYVGITNTRRTLRGEEIDDYLKIHSNIEDYAILDDDSDMLPEQFNKFHHCDGWFGLSPNHLYRIKRQFEKGSSYENITKTVYS